MHYFKKNIGDYHKKAGRLSMLQHGAYTLLIDSCYDREKFPTLEDAIDWAWASSADEVEAVEFVLKKFFTLENGVFVQDRIREEIEKYHSNAKNNKRIAIDREAKRREKRAKRDTDSTKRARTVDEPARQDDEAPPNQELRTTNQEPLTINQEPNSSKTLVPSVEDTSKVDERDEWFEQIWKAYPKRDGAKGNKQKTFALCCKIAGQDHGKWGELWKTVSKYAGWADQSGNTGTSMIQQTTTFFGKDKAGYLESWDITAQTGLQQQEMSRGDKAMAETLKTLEKTDFSWLDEV